jgi:uncharacterized protein YndB with AHSA1/START domain
MHIILIILLVIAGLIALLLIAALFLKKEYAVERSVTINQPKQQVFDYIRLLRNQDNYSKWASMDPNMKKGFTGTDGTPGCVSSWEGNKKVGAGEQEILKVTEGERIDYELRFIKPFRSTSHAYMSTEAATGGGTTVKWHFTGNMKYPFNAMQLFFNMEKAIGGDLDTGLGNLKRILEK